MPFPRYIKGWFSKKPDGWEDLGEVRPVGKVIDGKLYSEADRHSVCYSQLRVGCEKSKLFRFCPMCMVRLSAVFDGDRQKRPSRKKR